MKTVRRIIVGRPPFEPEGGLWIVPDGHIARVVRNRLLEATGSLGSTQVWTLGETVSRILSQAGEGSTPSSTAVRHRLVAWAMARQRDTAGFTVAPDPLEWPGVRRAAARHIRLFRDAQVPPEVLIEISNDLVTRDAERTVWFARLLRDYTEQGSRLVRRVTDDAQQLERALAILAAHPLSDLIPGVRKVTVYGFVRMTALMARFLSAIRGVEVVDVYVPGRLYRGEMWRSLGWAALEAQGFVRVPGFQGEFRGEFRRARVVSRGYSDEQKQWEGVANWLIRRLEEGCAPERVAVVTFCPLTPESPLVRTLTAHGVPLAEPILRPLLEIPVIQHVLSVLELPERRWSKDLLYYVASGAYAPDGRDRRAVLARWADLPPGRRGVEAWIEGIRAALAGSGEAPVPEREQEKIEDTLRWLQELRDLLSERPVRASLAEWAVLLEHWLSRLGLEEGLRRRAYSAVPEEWRWLRSDIEAFGKLRAVLREWLETEGWLSWPGRCTFGEMITWLREELAVRSVAVLPAQQDGVRAVSPEIAWAMDFDAIVVPNLNEGVFPRDEREDWLLPDSLYDELEKRGYAVERPGHRSMEQELWFLLTLDGVRSEAELTYVQGAGVLPSRCLENLWRSGFCTDVSPQVLPGDEVDDSEGPPFVSLAQWRRREHRIAQLFRSGNSAEGPDGVGVPPGEQPALKVDRESGPWRARWLRIAGKAVIERLREGHGFSPWEGRILDDPLRGLLNRSFSENRVYSASLFNDYGACPFRFFAKRVIGIEPARESREALDPAAVGSVYHRMLAALFREAQGLGDPGIWVDAERAKDLLAQIWESEMERLEGDSRVTAHPGWPLQKERMWERLLKWVDFDWEVRRRGNSDLRPVYLEWSFGQIDEESDPQSSPVPVEVAGLLFRGRIDRIDATPDGRFVLYDYKRTTGGDYHGKRAIGKGVDLQLPIYVAAVRRVLLPEGRPLGVAYYGLEPPDRQREGLWLKGEEHGLGPRVGLSVEEWEDLMRQAEEYIREYHASMRDGFFPVAPRACFGPACEYARICRKDDVRLLRKGVAAGGEEDNGTEAD